MNNQFMVSKPEIIKMIEQAIEVEEDFLPRFVYLMDQQIKMYRISFEKEQGHMEIADKLIKLVQ